MEGGRLQELVAHGGSAVFVMIKQGNNGFCYQ